MTDENDRADDMQDFTVPGRTCGTCTMCCKVLYITDFAKPAGRWCSHVKPGVGCSIYEQRPQSCRTFLCKWLQDENMGDEWKPERAKFAISQMTEGGNLLIAVDPNFANAWRRPPYFNVIHRWIIDGAAQGRFVFVRIGERCLALLPDGERDLGAVGPLDRIAVSRQAGPAGPIFAATVHRHAA